MATVSGLAPPLRFNRASRPCREPRGVPGTTICPTPTTWSFTGAAPPEATKAAFRAALMPMPWGRSFGLRSVCEVGWLGTSPGQEPGFAAVGRAARVWGFGQLVQELGRPGRQQDRGCRSTVR